MNDKSRRMLDNRQRVNSANRGEDAITPFDSNSRHAVS